jgi:hypothetical protein
MQVSFRRGDPNATDHEFVWLCASLAALAVAAAWFAIGLPWPRCVFHELTGLPCATCGATRSAIQFFRGHFLAAWRWNPLIFMFLLGLTVFDIYAFFTLVTRAPRLRVAFRQMEKKYARGVVIAAFALNWIYLLSHWRDF